MADCIFCKIISGKIPCNKVYEDANTLAFLDAAPTSLGHTLVVSKNHYETFDEMKEIDVKSLAITAHKIAKAFKKISEGYNLIQNNKKVAGQVVPHVHFHIVPRKEISIQELKGKVIAVDAFNAIYQFLSSIRQYDGTPLMDKQGRVSSHLSGLFYRNIALLSEGIKLVYVFDGKPPKLKFSTNEYRKENKNIAKEKYEEAKKSEDFGAMRKYSQQMSKIDDEMIKESKELLEAMGIAIIQAPSEGEAQASELSKHKDIYAVASQDYDCLLFGAPRLIQNLTLSRKRKTSTGFIDVNPELIELERVLNYLQINHDQLIVLGILTGTDYNPGGIKGIGPKKAVQIVQKFKTPIQIFNQYEEIDFDWKEIFELFKKPDVDYYKEIEFPKIDHNKIKKILVEHDFSEERIDKQIEKLMNIKEKGKQKTLF